MVNFSKTFNGSTLRHSFQCIRYMIYNFSALGLVRISCLCIVSILFLSLESCKKGTMPTVGSTTNPPPSQQKRILALGDSYTIGESLSEPERFPNRTISILTASSINLKYPSQIIARTGWTTQNLLNELAVSGNMLTPPYDIVTLLIGVNDQFQRVDTAIYRVRFLQCLNKAIDYTGSKKERVFVLSIPDYSVTPFGAGNAEQIAREIDWFNAINKQVTLQMGINYTDITPSSRMAATDRTLLAPDSLHPSGKEYLKWANFLAPKILPLLQ